MLEHLNDPEKVLFELKQKLKKDGLILGSIPNGYGLTEIEKFVIHKFFIYDFLRFFGHVPFLKSVYVREPLNG